MNPLRHRPSNRRPFGRRSIVACGALVLALSTLAVAQQQPRRQLGQPEPRRSARLFPPERLGELEGPDRELWQKPDQIMDALGIADGSSVADLGAGGGWFTVRLARRVGPQGVVYAEDVQEQMIESMERRLTREGLRNVKMVLGAESDPRLPKDRLDAVLIVDVYHEVEQRVGFLGFVRDSLRAQGRLGIVEFRKDGVGPGPAMEERIDESAVLSDADAAGFRLISRETFLPYQFLLIFGKK
jgi:predicted methyltransferase